MSGPLVITLKDKLEFIESLLIPSFTPKFNLNTPEKRDAWMTSRAKATNWDEKIFGELLIRFGTIENLKEAKEKEETLNKQKMLEIAEKMPVEMKAETLHEMAPSGTPVTPRMFLFHGVVHNGKKRTSCRYTVYVLAETQRAKVRIGEPGDGIQYDSAAPDDLRVQLLFSDQKSAENFETEFFLLAGRWRKRPTMSSDIPDLSIESAGVSSILYGGTLARVMRHNYAKLQKVGDTEVSPDFDQYSWTSANSTVEIDASVRWRLLEREDSKALFRQNAERCHVIPKSEDKDCKYVDDPNNIVFLSRNLHQQYDALGSSTGTEQFYLQYVRHDPNPRPGVVNKKQCPVYTTTVNVVFIDADAKIALHSDFKHHSDVNDTTIQLELHFPDPRTFEHCARVRSEKTCARWKSYAGISD